MLDNGERKSAAEFQDFLAKADYCERKAQGMNDQLARHWHAMAALALRRREYA